MDQVYISVDQRTYDKALQISINFRDEKGGGHGYRLAGPKYDGFGKTLLKHVLTERDIDEIAGYLKTARAALKKAKTLEAA